MNRGFIAFVAAAGFACGSSNSANNSNNTLPDGSTAGTQLGYVLPATTCTVTGVGSYSAAAVFVAQSDRTISNACTAVTACTEYKNTKSVGIAVVNVALSGTASAVATGTYNVGTPTSLVTSLASVTSVTSDANCADTTLEAKSGTVTLTKVQGTIEGSYNVTMTDGSTKSGSFSAPVCTGSASPFGDVCGSGATSTCTGTPTCS